MEYTLGEKAIAVLKKELWWRFPDAKSEHNKFWTLVHDDQNGVEIEDIERADAVYHIGPKAPPILSELEAELLAALEQIAAISNKDTGMDWDEIDEARAIARAAIKKARGEA
jgi:hypothetical protein